ncbi:MULTISPECIES: phage tail protein [Rodentibacter]|uniref:Phage tail protein n=1 Tax=Rodentibacter pneumotropicus TaxID=758 RepID=A0A4S2QJ23_9PAST|nr:MULTISPECIES: phage tail protein [Pasteurellaceae]TGY50820.1 phage tail protein [Pasteurella caecimuris]THA00952.1 phage tail protein [Rodentibacter pneumotropicus]THA08188.1 phage tail protein [Rodentibacter pneumotropicus]THA17248.1 phage tail protein [Rodentibacter pneumotropicus]
MKVYFLKSDISQFVIFPEPENLEDYFLAEVEDESELARKSAVFFKSKFRLVEKRPSEEHDWNGKTWIISKTKITALFTQRKTALLQRIADKTDQFKAQYLQGYSQAEIDSFYRQEREARNELPEMILTAIFEGRDDLENIEELKKKVIEKADLFAIVMGKLFAIKQNFETHIEQAETLEDLDKIEQEIEQWQKL